MLNIFDPDGTHDSLFAQKIKGQILTLLTNALGHRSIFDNPFPVALIERTAPGALNPWADDWTGKMFEFLKPLSRTFILDDGYLNGAAYGFEPEYTADLPEAIDLEDYHLDRLTVRVPPNSEGILTWLERTHDEQSAPYCSKVTNKIAIAMRRSRVFRTGAKAQEWELSTRNWLHNSVCFQGLELVGLTANQANFLLYDNIQSFLDFLMGELNLTPCKVLTQMVVRVRARGQTVAVTIDPTNEITEVLTESPIFSTVPNDYGFCYSNINGTEQGNKTILYDRQNEQITLTTNFVYSAMQGWEESLAESSPWGYDEYQEPFSTKTYESLRYFVGQHSIAQLYLKTFKNNQYREFPWNPMEKISYPPLSRSQREAGGGWYQLFPLEAVREDTGTELIRGNGNMKQITIGESNIDEMVVTYPDYPSVPGGSTTIPSRSYSGYVAEGRELTFDTNSVAVSLLADDDLSLFAWGETAIIQCSVDCILKSHYEEVWYPETESFKPDYLGLSVYQSYLEWQKYKKTLRAVLRVEITDTINILETQSFIEASLIETHRTVNNVYGALSFATPLTDWVESETFQTIRREFR